MRGVPIGGSATWGKCELGEVTVRGLSPLSGYLRPFTAEKRVKFLLAPTSISPNWHFPQLALSANFVVIENFELSKDLYVNLFRLNRRKLIFLQFIGDTIMAIGSNIANINQVLLAMLFWGKKSRFYILL